MKLNPLTGNRHFTKHYFINAKVAEHIYLPAEIANKELNKRFVERFEYAVRLRGESVAGALNTLRAQGFVVNVSTLNRWKRGIFPNFNSFQFIVLAQYVGKSLAEMIAE